MKIGRRGFSESHGNVVEEQKTNLRVE